MDPDPMERLIHLTEELEQEIQQVKKTLLADKVKRIEILEEENRIIALDKSRLTSDVNTLSRRNIELETKLQILEKDKETANRILRKLLSSNTVANRNVDVAMEIRTRDELIFELKNEKETANRIIRKLLNKLGVTTNVDTLR